MLALLQIGPVIWLVLAVVALVVLISRFKWPAFLALAVVSLMVGMGTGMPLPEVVKSFQEGVGAILSSIAVVVGFGALLGKLLAESGGAEVLAGRLIGALGRERLHWTMMLAGFIVGIPVWFSVGVVLLAPVLFSVVRESGVPLLRLMVPLLAGLSVAHGLIPPHPGPMVAIETLRADAGKTIWFSILVGYPTAVIAGPLIAAMLQRLGGHVELSGPMAAAAAASRDRRPGFGLTLFTILLPVLLMTIATVADLTLPKGNAIRSGFDFLGSPLVAMLVSVLFAFFSFGGHCGFDRKAISQFCDSSLGPVATVLLVVGAGGGFNRVLINSGIGKMIADAAHGASLSPLVLGWLVAALIRVATGSATVAITTAAGILAPVVAGGAVVNLELLVIAMGAGSLVLSHLNDGGFWFVKEYFGLTVGQTLKTWTVVETVVSLVALAFTLALDSLLRSPF